MSRPLRIFHALWLGLLVSVLVAWALGWLNPGRPTKQVTQFRLGAETLAVGSWHWLGSRYLSIGYELMIFRRAKVHGADDVPRYQQMLAVMPHDLSRWIEQPSSGMYHEVHGYGLPFLCLARGARNASPRDYLVVGRGRDSVYLPLRPIWPGLVANTLIWGAVMYPLVGVPGRVRGGHRRRQGRCPHCAYDLRGAGGDVCAECGARLNR